MQPVCPLSLISALHCVRVTHLIQYRFMSCREGGKARLAVVLHQTGSVFSSSRSHFSSSRVQTFLLLPKSTWKNRRCHFTLRNQREQYGNIAAAISQSLTQLKYIDTVQMPCYGVGLHCRNGAPPCIDGSNASIFKMPGGAFGMNTAGGMEGSGIILARCALNQAGPNL